ncbi:energy-coupling factor transporter ATPase [uncultured Limosilactobacillus sp.]|uniref:energy-coupling factor transporter ATPase n=1 Tax=uncultured Limosilactobacillus sp. TaxID=2837629 RepID=UPI0025F7E2BB|nr:energy-coupling factor transporter ATPase [uncultured Limosilactobacillus sp.]
MVKPAVNIRKLNYIYENGTSFAHHALKDVTVQIMEHQITAIIGPTGSGKSTLMQLVDGLLTPTSGQITVQNQTVNHHSSKDEYTKLRHHIGFVFQFPETQLFADTVIQDVMFGPLNKGLSEGQAREQAQEALRLLKFPEQLFDHSPFQLSGGQMRRVAIAGVLAMKPSILILDEPTAGLDPSGQRELMQIVQQLYKQGITIILITHQMEQVVEYANQVIALQKGEVVFQGTPNQLFTNHDLVSSIGLAEPQTVAFARQLREQGLINGTPLTIDSIAEEIIKSQKKRMISDGQ